MSDTESVVEGSTSPEIRAVYEAFEKRYGKLAKSYTRVSQSNRTAPSGAL